MGIRLKNQPIFNYLVLEKSKIDIIAITKTLILLLVNLKL